MEDLKIKFRSLFSPQDPQKKNSLPPKAHFSIWYFLVAFLVFALIQQYILFQKVETIPYSRFKQYLAEEKVAKLTISPEDISGTLKGKGKEPGQDFTTIRVTDPDLVKDLDAHKVNYSGHYESRFLSGVLSWILPIWITCIAFMRAIRRRASTSVSAAAWLRCSGTIDARSS
jgi:cell division protease FtsH